MRFRPSRAGWVERLPEHWREARTRFVAAVNPTKSEASHLDEGIEVTFVPMEAVSEDGTIDTSRSRTLAEVAAGYTYFVDGDILVAKITPCFENGKAAQAVGLAHGIGFGSTEFHVLRARRGLDRRFLLHLVRSAPFREFGTASMYGAGGQKRVPTEFMMDFVIPLPPPAEQRAIADFLDRETAKIDALIATQARLIALLDEKRQATITHAVTKGLDPDAPMKESGVEWLGEVPAHWNISPLRYVARFTAGAGFPDAEQGLASEELPFFKVKDLSSGAPTDKLYETDNTISRNTACRLRATIFPEGTIVFAKIGAALLLNRFRMVGCNCCIDNNMMGMQCIPRVITPRFARMLMSLLDMRLLVNPGAVPSLSEGKLSGLKVAVPPLDEQGAIEEHLDHAVAEIDYLRKRSETVIERLRERRTALITAAVTGQVDVSHPAITEAAK